MRDNVKPELSICIAMGVLNEASRLPACLRNLREQDFPRQRLHLLVADGGSRDATREVARKYGATVYDNPRVLGDLGIKLLATQCRQDLFLPWAPDNEFPRPDWLRRVADIFAASPGVSAFWGGIMASAGDTPVNKYYALIQSDPLAWFLNKNLYRYMRQNQQVSFDGLPGYAWKIKPAQPLVCGANGFVFRFSDCKDLFVSPGGIMENDIYQTMVERGNNSLAYVPALGVYHHSISSLGDWARKWKRNYERHFLTHYRQRNLNWIYTGRLRAKLALWLVYSLCPLVSGIDALWRAFRDRDWHWLYHPPACFLQTITYAWITVRMKNGRQYLLDFVKKRLHRKALTP